MFSALAIDRARETEWDPIECRVVREDDLILREQIEASGLLKEAKMEFDLGILDKALDERNID